MFTPKVNVPINQFLKKEETGTKTTPCNIEFYRGSLGLTFLMKLSTLKFTSC